MAAWPWALLVGVGLLVGAPAGMAAPASKAEPVPSGAPASPGTGGASEPTPSPAGPEAEGLPPIDEAALAGPQLLDGVLPCGLRVIVAQDESLPVAAVVLAVETGTEDDPQSQPGLVHALAYHLMQGNRELRPGGAPALVHDQGGIAGIAVGPAQVRYESLVPSSALPDVLWIESQRLRAPTMSDELWTSTLRWARRDTARAWRAPRAAMAAAHGAPGLDHEGRVVSKGLDDMVPRAVGLALAERFRYEFATLVVVSPHPPEELRETIERLFSDLPQQPRRVRDRSPHPTDGSASPSAPKTVSGGPVGSSPSAPKTVSGGPVGSSPSAPKALALAGESGTKLVWPVAPDPASLLQATVWCKGLNRQRRHEGEAARVRVKCHLDVDPRRPTLIVEATGADDPVALVRARIDRLEQEDAPLVERQRQAVRHEQVLELRTPLPLARRLAAAAEASPPPAQAPEAVAADAAAPEGTTTPPPTGWRTRPVSALTGLAVLAQPWTGRRFGPRLHPGAAIHLVAPAATPKPETPKP